MSSSGPQKKRRRFANPAGLLGVGGSPLKKVAVVAGSPDSEDSQGFEADFRASLVSSGHSDLHRPASAGFSSPPRPDRGPQFVTTPKGKTKLVPWVRAMVTKKESPESADVAEAPLTLYAPENKRQPNLKIPKTIPPVQGNKRFKQKIANLAEITTDLTEHKITRRSIDEVTIAKSRNQNKVMGNLSAKQVAKAMGFNESEARNFQWLHGLAYFYGGESAQRKNNLFLGTKNANAQMAVFCEMAIQKTFERFPDIAALYIQVEPIWEDGVEDYRLPSKLRYAIKNGRGDHFTVKVTFDIDPLSMDLVNKNDTQISDAIADALFQNQVSFATPVKGSASRRVSLTGLDLASTAPAFPQPLLFSSDSRISGATKSQFDSENDESVVDNRADTSSSPALPVRPSFFKP